jgi:hypothetical protein
MSAQDWKQFDLAAQGKVIAAVEERAWGDVINAIACLDEALRLATEASGAELAEWENRLCAAYGDEFSVPPEAVASMDQVDRLAYVARLVRTVALMWGTSTEDDLVRFSAYAGLGGLLRKVADIAEGWDRLGAANPE